MSGATAEAAAGPEAGVLNGGGASGAALARAARDHRQHRDRVFAGFPGLFGEPAWDILLTLSAVDDDAAGLPLAHACDGGAVSPTTARRWIGVLIAQGLVTRDADGGRLRLSAQGRQRMAHALIG